jgi:hypothetical protein
MNQTLVWMHHYALSDTHPAFQAHASGAACVYVWDDNYLRSLNYSLNRLVFIYETLCELPVEIIRGDMFSVLTMRPEKIIYVASSQDEAIQNTILSLQQTKQVITLSEVPFISAPHDNDYTRFSAYWRKVESLALSADGGCHGKND